MQSSTLGEPVAAGSGEPLLAVRGLTVRFPQPRGQAALVVDGVDLSVRPGETLGIVGESGSGKSLLVRSLMGLLPTTAEVDGEAEFDGADLLRMPARRRQSLNGRELAMILQNPMISLNPVRRIGAQLIDPLRVHLGLSRKDATHRAVELLDLVRIPEAARRIRQYPHELSGGMRQRVTIAIALACSPKLIIADEPTTALDVTVQRQILDLLGSIQRDLGMAMILITHDLGVVADRADRIAVMYAGRLVERGPAADILYSPRHRYTEALLAAIPSMDQPMHTRLRSIDGGIPDPTRLPAGCRFAPRCAFAVDECHTDMPELFGSATHSAACFVPSGGV
ncbi:ABC transporter ATP-binding protein [Rhodococcus globerulus]|uniref:ABC transporter ATP-binding protein n=1 Tax=Rhodococcus globerulus TaxID=33008 RepID=A0ABU4C3X5_RHOGO|nr:ABC transporter ATP-binding protein [Rhodococcus globerulus]MDV6271207.1 ABC transporter ATP-binding protein [Rhodococcus globerulus]